MPAVRQAVEQLRSPESRSGEGGWKAGKPLAEALADLDEALQRGRAEIEKARSWLVEEPDAALVRDIDALLARRSWLGRRLHRGYHAEVRAIVARQDGEKRKQFFDAFLEGYDLIRARLSRSMQSEQIERIVCFRQPVDPDRMVVLEVVEDASVPAGSVIEEVRRGYTWRQRVLRPAEVRAAREPLPSWDVSGLPGRESESSDGSS